MIRKRLKCKLIYTGDMLMVVNENIGAIPPALLVVGLSTNSFLSMSPLCLSITQAVKQAVNLPNQSSVSSFNLQI